MADEVSPGEALRAYVRASSGDLADCELDAATAEDMIATAIVDAVFDVPETIRQRAVLQVGAELFNARMTKNGISQFASPDGQGTRIARDPMVAANAILAPYVGAGIA